MTKDEADSALRQAIINHAMAYDIAVPDELLSEYAVIASWQSIEEDGQSRYTTQFQSARVPIHVAVGLFRTGEHLMLNQDPDGD